MRLAYCSADQPQVPVSSRQGPGAGLVRAEAPCRETLGRSERGVCGSMSSRRDALTTDESGRTLIRVGHPSK
jgi:hypothetical protein